jgi:hypothetical protein
VTQKYKDAEGVPIKQVGLINAQTTIDWVVAQQAAGSLAQKFSSLVVMGCSAGSVGTQIWSKEILSTFRYDMAAVVPDSYAGVFPPGSQGPLIRSFGFCTWDKLSRTMKAKCYAGNLSLQDINEVNQDAYPRVPFSFIQSKTDHVQMEFYIAIGMTTRKTSALITPANFYNNVTEIFGAYNKEHRNFVTYLVDGFNHCFTNKALYYDANCLDPKKPMADNTCSQLYSWTGSLPLSARGKVATQCQGPVIAAAGDIKGNLRGLDTNSTKTAYCSQTVVPKSYTQV